MTSPHARARRARRAAGLDPDGRRSLEAYLDELDAESRARLAELRAAHRPGRSLFGIEGLSLAEALMHPVFGDAFGEAIVAAHASAHDIGPGLMAECWGCRTTWAPELQPTAGVAITLPDGKTGLAALLCRTCSSTPRDEAQTMLLAGLRRDFGLEDAAPVPACAFAPGGRA